MYGLFIENSMATNQASFRDTFKCVSLEGVIPESKACTQETTSGLKNAVVIMESSSKSAQYAHVLVILYDRIPVPEAFFYEVIIFFREEVE
jgi:hypothetical protein